MVNASYSVIVLSYHSLKRQLPKLIFHCRELATSCGRRKIFGAFVVFATLILILDTLDGCPDNFHGLGTSL
jgi:hypothetical protein